MKMTVRDLTLASLFTALTAVGAFVSIPLGPVPVTLQSLFVLLAGMTLAPKVAVLSQTVYILLGLAGLPIFSGFMGGLQTVLRPSFGFLIGFVAAAFVVSVVSRSGKSIGGYILAGALGTVTMYLIGIPYMAFILNGVMGSGLSFGAILNMGLFLFLPGDILKVVLAGVVATRFEKTLA